MTVRISVGETATMQYIAVLHSDIASAFSCEPEIVLDPSATVQADLSLIQLIHAARRQADHDGVRFNLAQPANACLHTLLVRAGFTAAMTPADIEFWFHGDMPQ